MNIVRALSSSPDAKVIAVTCFKGGVGKSSVAANLIVAASKAGNRVLAIDADRQGSLSLWLDRRRRAAVTQIDGRSVDIRDAAALVCRTRHDYDLIVIDMPGRDDAAVTEVMRHADLSIVPTRPSTLDADAAQRTVDAMERLGRPYGVLVNQANAAASARTRAWAELYDVAGKVIDPIWVMRVAHQDAIAEGLSVLEWQPAGFAALEVLGLWVWVTSRLPMTVRGVRNV